MAERRQNGESSTRGGRPDPGQGKCCAYNQSRERFLCGDIETGDFNPSGLEARLGSLLPGCGAALWIVPFRGISAMSVRVPVDLVYLDRNQVVLDLVESFPISTPSSSGPPAASVLALPANSLAAAETRIGDRLIVCSPEQMKLFLAQMLSAGAGSRSEERDDSAPDATARRTGGRVLRFVDRSQARPEGENPPREAAPLAAPAELEPEPAPAERPALPEIAAAPEQKKPKAKGWFQKLLNPDPPQPRKAQRDVVHGLAAFYFTGGDPAPHAVRDISPTGLYLLTDERWYPGTVIRMTLTDKRPEGAEKSIMVHAAVVRWGNDGVGLQFVLADERSGGGSIGGASRAELEQFIGRLKIAAP